MTKRVTAHETAETKAGATDNGAARGAIQGYVEVDGFKRAITFPISTMAPMVEPGPELTAPTLLPVSERVDATPPVIEAAPDPRDEQIWRLRAALEEIADPLKVWSERARREGQLLSAIHYPKAHNADVLKVIARRALGVAE